MVDSRQLKTAWDVDLKSGGTECDFAFRGPAVGECFIIDHSIPKLDSDPVEEDARAAELESFESHLTDTLEQLTQKMSEAQNEDTEEGREKAQFAGFEFGILSDKTITDPMRHHIDNGVNMAKAVEMGIAEAEEKWRKTDSVQIRAKVDDLRSAGRRLIRNMLNLPQIDLEDIPEGKIIVADYLSATEAIDIFKNNPAGIILMEGSPSGHVGDLCRGKRLPCAYARDSKDFDKLVQRNGRDIALDGRNRSFLHSPTKVQRDAILQQREFLDNRWAELNTKFKGAQAKLADGTPINLQGTVAGEADAAEIAEYGISNIGLFRTEYVIERPDHMPSEEEQISIYSAIMDRGGKDMTVRMRTFDFQGDKSEFFHYTSHEERMAVLKIQMRAMIQVAAMRPQNTLEIMIPNMSLHSEFKEYKALYEEAYQELQEEGKAVPEQMPAFGIMSETASVAFNLDLYESDIDFVSGGTNDFPAAYTASERNRADHQRFQNIFEPETLRGFAIMVESCKKMDKPYSICGARALNENLLALWVGMGIETFSIPPASVLEMRYTLSRFTKDEAKALWDSTRGMTAQEIREAVKEFNADHGIGLENTVSAPKDSGTNPDAPKADGQR